jgi:Methyltransferase domain
MPRVPWQATARAAVQRVGLDPRSVRRLRWLHKARVVRQSGARIRRYSRFVLSDPEPDNFTYEITNEPELVDWVATVAGCDPTAASAYIAEPRLDEDLRARLRQATVGRWLWTKRSPAFGKRLGWYALVRAIRPELVIETGVHDGLGSLLLLRALERNLNDGHAGRLVSFDINPTAGWLVGTHPLWDLRIQSSRDGLPDLLASVDRVGMSVYDGWHSYDDERWDLQTTAEHLAAGGVLLSDDAQTTHALADLCRESGLAYVECQESPAHHFYPGSVLAAARSATVQVSPEPRHDVPWGHS